LIRRNWIRWKKNGWTKNKKTMKDLTMIKELVVRKIQSIQDGEYLETLLKQLESRPQDKVKLTDAEKHLINTGMEDYRNGRVMSQEEVEKEDEEWLHGK